MRILVGVDGSDCARLAVDVAARLAEATGGELVALLVAQTAHVAVNGPLSGFEWGSRPLDPDLQIETPDKAESMRLLDEAAGIAGRHGIALRKLRSVGHAADRILVAAAEQDIDLIVVGSHGRTGLQRFLMGSIAETVVRHAACSVMVAKRELAIGFDGDTSGMPSS